MFIGAALLPFCISLGEEIQDFLIVVALGKRGPERVEVRLSVVPIDPLRFLQPAGCRVGHGCEEDLHAALEEVIGNDDLREQTRGHGPAEGKQHEHHRVKPLPDQG